MKWQRQLTQIVIIKGRDTLSTSEIINDQRSKEHNLEHTAYLISLCNPVCTVKIFLESIKT